MPIKGLDFDPQAERQTAQQLLNTILATRPNIQRGTLRGAIQPGEIDPFPLGVVTPFKQSIASSLIPLAQGFAQFMGERKRRERERKDRQLDQFLTFASIVEKSGVGSKEQLDVLIRTARDPEGPFSELFGGATKEQMDDLLERLHPKKEREVAEATGADIGEAAGAEARDVTATFAAAEAPDATELDKLKREQQAGRVQPSAAPLTEDQKQVAAVEMVAGLMKEGMLDQAALEQFAMSIRKGEIDFATLIQNINPGRPELVEIFDALQERTGMNDGELMEALFPGSRSMLKLQFDVAALRMRELTDLIPEIDKELPAAHLTLNAAMTKRTEFLANRTAVENFLARSEFTTLEELRVAASDPENVEAQKSLRLVESTLQLSGMLSLVERDPGKILLGDALVEADKITNDVVTAARDNVEKLNTLQTNRLDLFDQFQKGTIDLEEFQTRMGLPPLDLNLGGKEDDDAIIDRILGDL